MARLLDDVDELGYLERRSRARRMATQLDAVRLAEQHPEVMVDLVDEATRVDGEWAVRATVADLSARANVSEQTVYVEIRRAETLQRTPGFWNDFQTGTVSVANMLALAEVLDTLPSDAGVDAEMDAAAVVAAQVMPGRFRSRMRAVRERLHPESLERRSRAAAERRCARMQPAEDGMAWYGIFGPAAAVAEVDAHVDARARHLAEQHDETRTLDQIRADVALALLCSQGDGEASVTVELGLMVPVLTLLGRSDEPARLEGYGPIDVDTARELAGRATSFVRVLTHPVTGTILDIDRSKHRPPADLQRWVRVRDQACSFLGCGRRAAACDIDHTVAWAHGGATAAHNLTPLCPPHHRLKHQTRWHVERPPGQHRVRWRSPMGVVRTADPPPF